MESNIKIAVNYHHAVGKGATGSELTSYLTEDFVHRELPNLIFPDGATSDLTEALEAAERGQAKIAAQDFRILNTVAMGDTVALEIEWTGTLKSGPTLRAHIATFLDFRDGKICAQRNYDCYEQIPPP